MEITWKAWKFNERVDFSEVLPFFHYVAGWMGMEIVWKTWKFDERACLADVFLFFQGLEIALEIVEKRFSRFPGRLYI